MREACYEVQTSPKHFTLVSLFSFFMLVNSPIRSIHVVHGFVLHYGARGGRAIMAKGHGAAAGTSLVPSARVSRWCGFDLAQTRVALALFIFLWMPLVAWHEHVAFRVTSNSCTWPSIEGASSPVSHVAVIADPQLTDHTSYRECPKDSWTLSLVQRLCDAYQHRAFRLAVLPKRPDRVLFVGDLIDGGWQTGDGKVFDTNAKRFGRIFRGGEAPSSEGEASSSSFDSKNKMFLSVHGNHDVGYAAYGEKYEGIQTRHEQRFGVSNYVEHIGGVDVIAVNAMALDGGENSTRTMETLRFVEALGDTNETKNKSNQPRVLVTHLPLFKRNNELLPGSCGSMRAGPVIQPRVRKNRQGGIEYQDYLSQKSSDFLLKTVKPVLVLAGHDHDRCEWVHELVTSYTSENNEVEVEGAPTDTTQNIQIPELTLGTFSWLMGNPAPSFALMTLVGEEEDSEEVFTNNPAAVETCDLPEHLFGVWRYAYLGSVSTCVLLIWPSLRITAGFILSDSPETFARRVGVHFWDSKPATKKNSMVARLKVWLSLIVLSVWRHCGPLFVLAVAVIAAIVGGTLWDLSRF